MIFDEELAVEARQLYSSADIQNQRDACVFILHVFMLEYGFIPKDVPEKDKLQAMPNKWKAREMYKIIYCHRLCGEHACSFTCIPLYNTLSILGVICDSDCLDSINIKIDVTKHVKESQNFSNMLEVFKDWKSLSIDFKDGFCLPLLNLLQKTAGNTVLFGLTGLLSEIKVHVIELLQVEDIVSLSKVNKEFNLLTNQPQLWKFLFSRDFSKGGIPDVDISSEDWKQLYKKEYLKRNRRHEPRVCIYYPLPMRDPQEEFFRAFQSHFEYDDIEHYFHPPWVPRMPPILQRIPPNPLNEPVPHIPRGPALPNIPRMPPFFRRL